MTQQIINIGNAPNDGNGSPLRTAFTICNDNFSELYGTLGVSGVANGTSNVLVLQNSAITISSAGVSNVAVIATSGTNILGNISASGNITAAAYFVGDGSHLTNISSQSPASLITGNVLSSNVTSKAGTRLAAPRCRCMTPRPSMTPRYTTR